MTQDALKWDAQGLVTVVVQDRLSGEIRMLAHANREAVDATLETSQAHFYSRSRRQLWRKGESSGNTLSVSEVWVDCDGDALIYMVDPAGPSCHTNRDTCFFRRLEPKGRVVEESRREARPVAGQLWSELVERRGSTQEKSYTRSLLDKGTTKIGDKVREEANELAQALVDESDERVVSEAADVTYHLLVGLLSRDLTPRALNAELARRFGVSGHEEKASRTK